MWKYTTVGKSFFFTRKATNSTNTGNPIGATPSHKWTPHATVIGPLLFVIFINDMTDDMVHSYLCLFADDTKLFQAIHNITDCELLLEDLERVQHWTDQAQLELHSDTCKHMRIIPTNIPHPAFNVT